MIFLSVNPWRTPPNGICQRYSIVSFGFGGAVTYETREHEWKVWKTGQEASLWEKFEGNTVVGWNVLGTDLPLLRAAISPLSYTPEELDEIQPCGVIDLADFIRKESAKCNRKGRQYTIEEIAQDNLGRGLCSVQKETQWKEHCKHRIQLCIGMYDLLTTNGLRCLPRPERGEVGAIVLKL
jgi:hypothetical protein